MDLSSVDDITVLKAMAYDQIAAKEQAERNLQAINGRIVDVANHQSAPMQITEVAAADTPEEDLHLDADDFDVPTPTPDKPAKH